MTCNKKNDAIAQAGDIQHLTQETTSQDEELSSEEALITTGLQAGINYCRYMSEQMQEEIKILQDKLESAHQTNKVLRQNVEKLENEKNGLIANFQEEFRKFETLNNYIRQLEAEIQSIKEILETSMKLEEDIRQTRVEELKIRTNIQTSFEEQEMELHKIEVFLLNKNKVLKEKIDKISAFEEEQKMFHNMKSKIQILTDKCEEKIRNLTSMQNYSQNIEEIKQRIYLLRVDTNVPMNTVRTRLGKLLGQIKTEANLLRSQNAFLRDRFQREFAAKQVIFDELKIKYADQVEKYTKIEKEIVEEKLELENLEKKKEIDKKEVYNFENKLQTLKLEEKDIQETLVNLSREIQELQETQSALFEEQEKRQANINQLKNEKECIEKNLESQKYKINLTEKLKKVELENISGQEKNKEIRDEIQHLMTTKKNLEKQNVTLENEIQEEKQCIEKLRKISQQNAETRLVTNDKEMKFLNQLQSIKNEEYSIMEQTELAVDCLLEEFQKILSIYTELEFSFSQLQEGNVRINEEIRKNREMLQTFSQEKKILENETQKIKQYVYNGTYLTMQQLNKKYNLMMNGKNMEAEKVEKLEQEIMKLKERLSSRKEKLPNNTTDTFAKPIESPAKERKFKKYKIGKI